MGAAGEGAVIDLSARSKLRVTGADRLRYLNGQISNDLRKASETGAVQACVLSAKGKIDAEVFLTSDGDAFLIDTDADAGEALAARLERYIIADDVQLEDVTEAWSLFHVLGAEAPTLTGKVKRRAAARFGETGTDLWVEGASYGEMWERLMQTLAVCDAECAETLRIERGLPRWGHELTGEIIPVEANLEASAIDYAKGCYIGQEVISRIKMSGQTNKRLCGFIVPEQGVVAEGMRLMAGDKEVGWITSVTASARLGRQLALGFVKRGFQEIGTRLEARAVNENGGVTVEIAALPFA